MSADIKNLLQEFNLIDRKWSEIFSGKRLFFGKATHLQMAQIIFKQQEIGQPIVASELAKHLNISKAAVSQILAKWEKKNLIHRFKHEEQNKKFVYIIFKEDIYQEYLACKDSFIDSLKDIIELIGIDKVKQFINLVHNIQDVLSNNQQLLDALLEKSPYLYKKFI